MQLVVFDLDGTITRHDTLFGYVLGFLKGRPARALGLPLTLPAVCRFALGHADHGALKAALLRHTLRGVERSELEAWTQEFVPNLLAHGLFADARAALAAHQRAHDRLILMSASVDLYVPAVGRALGFEHVECTGTGWRGSHLTGELSSANCRGPEKARRLAQLRARHPGLLTVAYGNGDSDLEHLRLADRGVLVNGSRRARREAAAIGLERVHWR